MYNLFYLFRYFQIVDVKIPDAKSPLRVLNLHLEAFSKENRELHLIKLQDRLQDYGVDIAGGDFNGSILVSDELRSKGWEAKPSSKPTFPCTQPVDFLDGFIVRRERVQCAQPDVLQTGAVSDHLAIQMPIEFSDEKLDPTRPTSAR